MSDDYGYSEKRNKKREKKREKKKHPYQQGGKLRSTAIKLK